MKINKENRKRILLISDDFRSTSGVANVSRDIIINTCQHYNWFQLAGAVNHPDKGKIIDISEEINKELKIDDSNIKVLGVDGYGDPQLIRHLIKNENIDAIFLITDPRYFTFLFQIENEIRKKIPIFYLNIWDELPAPLYNLPFYQSCDGLFAISKQTLNINKLVLEQGQSKYQVI